MFSFSLQIKEGCFVAQRREGEGVKLQVSSLRFCVESKSCSSAHLGGLAVTSCAAEDGEEQPAAVQGWDLAGTDGRGARQRRAALSPPPPPRPRRAVASFIRRHPSYSPSTRRCRRLSPAPQPQQPPSLLLSRHRQIRRVAPPTPPSGWPHSSHLLARNAHCCSALIYASN